MLPVLTVVCANKGWVTLKNASHAVRTKAKARANFPAVPLMR